MAISKIGTTALSDDSVTTDKVANNAITTAMIASGEVGVTDLADGSITNAKISGSAAIAPSKIDLSTIAQAVTVTGHAITAINNSGNAQVVVKRGNSNTTGNYGNVSFQSSAGYYVGAIHAVGVDNTNNKGELHFRTHDGSANQTDPYSLTTLALKLGHDGAATFASNATFSGSVTAAGATLNGNVAISNSSGDTLTLTKSTTEPSFRIEGDSGKDFVITVSGELLTFTQNDGATDILTLDHDTGAATFSGFMGVNKAAASAVALSVGADSTSTTSYGLEVTNATSNTRFIVNGLGDSLFYRTDNAVGMKFDATNGNLEVTNTGGSNGTATSQYGIIAVSSGGAQATIGAHHNGDGYANLNLGSTVGGDRKMWHISKRMSSAGQDNRLEFFWYESGGFNSRFQFDTSGSFLANDQITSNKGVHATSVNHVDNGLIVKAGSGDTAASRGRFSNNAADVAIGRNIATFPGAWTKADNSVASAGWVFGTSGAAAFYQSNAGDTTPLANQRFRIMDNGRVVIGSSTTEHTYDATKILLSGTGTLVSAYNLASTNEFWILNNLANIASGVVCKVDFRVQNSSKGYIGVTSTGVQYNQGSDYRLKDELNYDFDATSLVKKIKPVQFKWLADMDAGIDTGFIAHELQEVHPFAVSGEKDAVREDGEIAPQGVDTSKLVGLLTKALQEALSRIDSLEGKVKALEEAA
jgi:hypothetical protein